MSPMDGPNTDHIQASASSTFPGDDQLASLTCKQVERCAALVAAYSRGHDGYRGALPEVARLLMLAGVTARAGLDEEETDLVAAWKSVEAWPFPRHGVPQSQPR